MRISLLAIGVSFAFLIPNVLILLAIQAPARLCWPRSPHPGRQGSEQAWILEAVAGVVEGGQGVKEVVALRHLELRKAARSS